MDVFDHQGHTRIGTNMEENCIKKEIKYENKNVVGGG